MDHHIRIIVPGLLLALLPALACAQDFSQDAVNKALPYKDLPGVQAADADKGSDEGVTCTQEMRLQNALRPNSLGQKGAGIVYRCEKDGIVVESPRPPLRKYWNPLEAQ